MQDTESLVLSPIHKPRHQNAVGSSYYVFLWFSRSGEITIPSCTAYDATSHLSWGDVAIDNTLSPKLLQVILKRSKTDQTGKGVKVFIVRTNGLLCPVTVILSYMTTRGSDSGPFFKYTSGKGLNSCRKSGKFSKLSHRFFREQFQDQCRNYCSWVFHKRLYHLQTLALEQ